ncbi:MAG: hypothetical protein M3P83_05980 [Actinomycetota bacterium]|nr:hypothetical protein [Actinomycetota bacterium]
MRDLIDDSEGITGHEEFRDGLRLLYLVTLDWASGDVSRAADRAAASASRWDSTAPTGAAALGCATCWRRSATDPRTDDGWRALCTNAVLERGANVGYFTAKGSKAASAVSAGVTARGA